MNLSEKRQILIQNSHYLECLKNELRKGEEYISAERIAENVGVSEVFVKRNLVKMQAVDEPDSVYHITTLIRRIHNWLDCEYAASAVLVGVAEADVEEDG